MKVAIPLYKDRVAPYFGSTSQILLAEIRSGRLEREAEWDVGGRNGLETARRLLNLGVEIIICGGIRREYKDWLGNHGVTVQDNKKGRAREVLRELITGFTDQAGGN